MFGRCAYYDRMHIQKRWDYANFDNIHFFGNIHICNSKTTVRAQLWPSAATFWKFLPPHSPFTVSVRLLRWPSRCIDSLSQRAGHAICLRACCFDVSSGPGWLYRNMLRPPLLREKLILTVVAGAWMMDAVSDTTLPRRCPAQQRGQSLACVLHLHCSAPRGLSPWA